MANPGDVQTLPGDAEKAPAAQAGERGDSVRSDCWIGITPVESGGMDFRLESKTGILYSAAIRKQIEELAAFFELENAVIEVDDTGAVPYVIAARFEAAVRRLGLDKGKRFILDPLYSVPENRRDRFRRSRLYLPGNTPKLFLNACLHGADGLILDLEDSVAPAVKEDARILVRNALRQMEFKGSERMVRINQGDRGLADLREILPMQPHVILIPKVETQDQIQVIDAEVDAIRSADPTIADVFYMPIIESALGVINAYPIAVASKRTVALAIGLEDYTADLGVQRSRDDRESFFARSALVNAARASGVQPIDTVFS
ncbi:MAG TPA: aldolase/citrate lyase family protein, partial [bacterium]|nr:aldolase/citrate lyase family protein [bacterium]